MYRILCIGLMYKMSFHLLVTFLGEDYFRNRTPHRIIRIHTKINFFASYYLFSWKIYYSSDIFYVLIPSITATNKFDQMLVYRTISCNNQFHNRMDILCECSNFKTVSAHLIFTTLCLYDLSTVNKLQFIVLTFCEGSFNA